MIRLSRKSWPIFALTIAILVGGRSALQICEQRIDTGIEHHGEARSISWARVMGAEYTERMSRLRERLGASDYFLVEASPPPQAGRYWVRFDLAPRRGLYLGTWEELAAHPRRVPRWIDPTRWVVVAHGDGAAPEALSMAELRQRIRERG